MVAKQFSPCHLSSIKGLAFSVGPPALFSVYFSLIVNFTKNLPKEENKTKVVKKRRRKDWFGTVNVAETNKGRKRSKWSMGGRREEAAATT